MNKLKMVRDDKGNPIDLTKLKIDSLMDISVELEFEVIALSSLIRSTEKDLVSHKKSLDAFLLDLELLRGYIDSKEVDEKN